ncbi:MAG TPA: alpha/beta hydrolase [Verrucomicrobiae bacterium]
MRVSGEGRQPMLFAHGFGCDQTMWRFVAPAFEVTQQVVLFDYVGSGKSDAKEYNAERYSSLRGYAQDVLDVCDALELREVVFVGHSVSSITGILAAIKRPDLFHSLILVAPSPRYIDDPPSYRGGLRKADVDELLGTMEKNYVGWANFLAPAVMQRPDRPELTEELAQSFCSTDPVIARRFAEATFYSDNRKDLRNVSTPTLILQCAVDAIAPLEVGEFMRREMQNSELRIIKTTGHCPHMSAPEETIAEMKSYLERLRAQKSSGRGEQS